MRFRTWGGKRAGAGRKPGPGRRGLVAHAKRPKLSELHPVHVTMRAVQGTWMLRDQLVFRHVRAQIAKASRDGTRIVHFSVQIDHVHLIVEAPDRLGLARRMQGLASGIARVVNGLLGRRGLPLWRGRYHRQDLTTPRAVRNRLVYVLMNHKKHRPEDLAGTRPALDPCSSAAWLEGWDPRAGPELAALARDPRVADAFHSAARAPVAPPKRWLTTTGWKRLGDLRPAEAPAPA